MECSSLFSFFLSGTLKQSMQLQRTEYFKLQQSTIKVVQVTHALYSKESETIQ